MHLFSSPFQFATSVTVLLLPLLATAYPHSRVRSTQRVEGELQLYKYPAQDLSPLRKVQLWEKEDNSGSESTSNIVSYNIVWTEKESDKDGRPATAMEVSNEQYSVAVEILKQVNVFLASAQDEKRKMWVIFSRPEKPGMQQTQEIEIGNPPKM